MSIEDLVKKVAEFSDPYKTVLNSVKFEGGKLEVNGVAFEVKGRIFVLGFGKASCPMAKAIEEILPVEDGVVVTKYGYSLPLRKIRVIEAGHPIPDGNSLKGALEGLKVVERVREDDILIVLVSGGGSSLFTLPEDGISLEDKIRTNELLLRCGARIHEINTVRKHISKVKGGKLVKNVKGVVVSLIMSDVVGDDLEVIASGPTVKDPTTFEDAYRILKLYDLWDRIPESVGRHIKRGLRGEVEETLKVDPPNVHNFLIASNRILCERLREYCESLGFNSYVLTTFLEGEAKDVALAIGSIVQEVHRFNRPFERPCVLIAGGETTVTLEGECGLGGPNQEFALSISRKIRGLEGVVVVSMDTDGTDGPTDSAGGVVDWKTAEMLEERGVDVEEVLKRHDSYNALKLANALLKTGPTRTNLNSVVVVVVR